MASPTWMRPGSLAVSGLHALTPRLAPSAARRTAPRLDLRGGRRDARVPLGGAATLTSVAGGTGGPATTRGLVAALHDWYWHSDERDRAPATGFRVQVVGNRGTNSDEQVPFEPQDASYTYVFEAHPGENGTVTITALSEAGPSDPVSIEWQMLSEPPSGLDMPTVKVNHKRDLATISWAPPSSDGGDADIRYNVYLDGKRRSASNRLSLVAKRLTRGKHTVSVQAYNSGGVTESAATVFRIR